MPRLVPESTSRFGLQEPPNALGLALEALLEFTQAGCGWIGLSDRGVGMSFPVRSGPVPDDWLDRQAGRDGVWGFAVRDGPTLLNDLPPLPGLQTGPLKNLLSCPLPFRGDRCDHVVAANKPGGFTSHDAAVAQGFAHLIGKILEVDRSASTETRPLEVLPPQFLEQSGDGVFVLDARGALVFANSAWTEWTGFSLEELLGQQAPFSFWLDHRQLAMVTGGAGHPASSGTAKAAGSSEPLPFQRADGTIFWCLVQSRRIKWGSDEWTIAWLRLWPPTAAPSPAVVEPAANWLALLLRPGHETSWWDERWTKLAGLGAADVAGVPVETVLDWLFPLQPEREFVADLFHQPAKKRSGKKAVLHVLAPGGSQPLLCTFLPVGATSLGPSSSAIALGESGEGWLLLVGEPETSTAVGPAASSSDLVGRFARGLSHLVNHYLSTPIGVAEVALDRDDLLPPVAAWFHQILDACRPAARLVAALQDLAAVDVGDTTVESLPKLVREVLDEWASAGQHLYDLTTDSSTAGANVRVNRRMICVVLRHLLDNARDSLLDRPERRIAVRVRMQGESACCEIEDSGEGMVATECRAVLAPFHSTKGPFARDATHAALPATGLGLTVSQHLLALHGGRLELRSRPGEGTTAVVFLPRAIPAPLTESVESVRFDRPSEGRRPHAVPGLPTAVEPPQR
jgi:PAS domain S-box-containing protein